ncbi:MAG: metallophosphoesterase [Deltaproteobacteria bacterium]|nr:metallophosphoesterase [Deltaproteobacteria bacterium]
MIPLDLPVNLGLVAIGIAVAWLVARRRLRPTVAAVLAAALGLGVAFVTMVGTGDVFAGMRALAWLLFAHLPLLLAWTAIRTRGTCRWVSSITAVAIVVLGLEAFVREPTALSVTRYTVVSAKVERPLRIAVLSDLQTDDPGAYERRAIRAVLDAEPDLILLPGDFVQARGRERNRQLRGQLRELLVEEGLAAPLGVYAVRGNVEHDGWTDVFDGLAVMASDRSTHHQQGPVSVTALSFRRGFDPGATVPGTRGFHIAFAHAPDFALGEIDADLLVAGHTHGGQVVLPGIGPLITLSRVPRAWASGLTALPGDRTLVVSRGVGMERGLAPRLRLLCTPEVVIIDVVPPRRR